MRVCLQLRGKRTTGDFLSLRRVEGHAPLKIAPCSAPKLLRKDDQPENALCLRFSGPFVRPAWHVQGLPGKDQESCLKGCLEAQSKDDEQGLNQNCRP